MDHRTKPGTVEIDFCSPYSLLGAASHLSDTLTIGPLTSGDYQLTFTYYTSISRDSCDPESSTDTSFIFKVSPPTVIQPFDAQQVVKIFPNPAKDILTIRRNDFLSIREINIRNMQKIGKGICEMGSEGTRYFGFASRDLPAYSGYRLRTGATSVFQRRHRLETLRIHVILKFFCLKGSVIFNNLNIEPTLIQSSSIDHLQPLPQIPPSRPMR